MSQITIRTSKHSVSSGQREKNVNDTTSQNSEDKCLIKMKKYKALFYSHGLLPHFLGIIYVFKGFKTRKKYFTMKTKTFALCPSM